MRFLFAPARCKAWAVCLHGVYTLVCGWPEITVLDCVKTLSCDTDAMQRRKLWTAGASPAVGLGVQGEGRPKERNRRGPRLRGAGGCRAPILGFCALCTLPRLTAARRGGSVLLEAQGERERLEP